MNSLPKIVSLVLAVQLAVAAAFLTSDPRARSIVYRPAAHARGNSPCSPVATSPLPFATRLRMAVAAPEKKKEKKVTDDTDDQADSSKDRGWLVRLYNDPWNKREFVARCLMEVCALDDGRAYTIMMQAHQAGIGVVGNYHRELAELYKTRLVEEGLLIDMVPADDDE